jgi:hypothetical protein
MMRLLCLDCQIIKTSVERSALLKKFKEPTRDCTSFKVILFSFENIFFSTFLHWLVEKSGSKNLDHYLDDFIFAGEENSNNC